MDKKKKNGKKGKTVTVSSSTSKKSPTKKKTKSRTKKGPKSQISRRKTYPPIDFSFKNISDWESLEKIEARTGKRFVLKEKQEEEHKASELEQMEDDLANINMWEDKKSSLQYSSSSSVEEKKTEKTEKTEKETEKRYSKYYGTTLKLCNNLLTDMTNFYDVFQSIVQNVDTLKVLDLSYNQLSNMENVAKNVPVSLVNLYLHANCFDAVDDVRHLERLKNLKMLTIHGNPLDQYSNYRFHVLAVLRKLPLKSLDFSTIVKRDWETADTYSQIYMKKFVNKRKKKKKEKVIKTQ